jgi:hypothetical protein
MDVFHHACASVLLLAALSGWARGAEILSLPTIAASVEAIPGWTAAPAATLVQLSRMTQPGVVAHARRKNVVVPAAGLESRILAIYSITHPGGDSPNVVLTSERIWGDPSGKSGKDYIELMVERCAFFAPHSQLTGPISEWKSGATTFHCADFENRRVPAAVTRQEYIATVRNGVYVVFVLSYNDKADADYQAMKAFAASYRPTE